MAPSTRKWCCHSTIAIALLTALGINVHKEKSITILTQVIIFLRFIINSNSTKFTSRKSEENSYTLPTSSYGRRCISPHASSATGGARVSSTSGVESPSSFSATSSTTNPWDLQKSKYKYESKTHLTCRYLQGRNEMVVNELRQVNGSPIVPPTPDIIIFTNAFKMGWSAVSNGVRTNGK